MCVPLAIIAVAVCLFGLAIEPLGLVVSLAILIVLAAWAGPQFRLVETVALALALIAFSVGVFVYALGSAAQRLAEPVASRWTCFSNLAVGFAVALTLQNLAYCFIGVLLGTVIGVLPGIGPVTTVAMLLPISFTLSPESALILLAGIYYGAQYGGSTTAILVNIPGEASSVVTTIDGHQMARQGRAGPALGIAALGSFFAGSVATLLIAVAAPPLAAIALQFGPAEYFSLMVCGLIAAVVLAHGSLVKAIAMVVLGLLLGLAGTDVNSGVRRFDFGMTGLADGVEFVALSMAIYGIAEVAYNLEKKQQTEHRVRRGRAGLAEPRRPQALRRRDPARHLARRHPRRAAGRRRAAGVVRRLYAREEGRQAAARFRQRRHSRRRGAGIRQQCRRADLLHPDADAWGFPATPPWR